jgi:capsular polysaccharide biosynthesis protein
MSEACLAPLFGRLPDVAANLRIGGPLPPYRRIVEPATLWGESGLVVDSNNQPLVDAVWFEDQLRNCPDFRHSWRRFFPMRRAGTYFSVMLYWCRGYYHWICDVLPRVQSAVPHLPPETRFVVPDGLSEAESESLQAIGIRPESWAVFRGKRPWRVERLVHVPPVAMTGDHTRESLLSLRESVFRHTRTEEPRGASRRIYVARRQGAERAVVNESELLPALQERGFELVHCESLSFADQVKLFREAEIIVGPHGGGFANLVWCEPGTKVFEIFGTNSVRRCYWSICQALSLNHHCAVAEEREGASLLVEPARFSAALDQLMN